MTELQIYSSAFYSYMELGGTMAKSIIDMFARSPLGPLQEHMVKADECAQKLIPFFQAVLIQDWDAAFDCQSQITKLEQKADRIKKDLRLHLPKGLFLPVPRSDILELLSIQDAVANRAEDIAGIVMGRKLVMPGVLSVEFQKYLKSSVDTSTQAKKAICELGELLESGFRGLEVKLVENMIIELDRVEHETDDHQISLRKSLFDIEATLPPVNVFFLYKVIDWVGDLSDCAQRAGGRLQILLAH